MKEPTTESIGKRVKALRLHKKWTQKELSIKAGTCEAYIGRLERGDNFSPTIYMINSIAKALGVSTKWLLFGDAQPTIDAVCVVRCKDCKFFSKSNLIMGKCTLRLDTMFLKDFCSYGVKRRENENSK